MQLNGGADAIIDSNSEFQFLEKLDDGSEFHVSILSQPTNPVQYCKLENNNGSLKGEAINDITVKCFDETIVVRQFPPDLSQRVPIDSVITARLGQAIDEATFGGTVLAVSDEVGVIDGTVTYDAATFTLKFDHTTNLDYDSLISVKLGNGLRDINSNPINNSWSFHTTTSQFTKLLANGANTITDNTLFGTQNFLRLQFLYNADSLSSTSGYIHRIQFKYAADLPTSMSCKNTSVKLGHSGVSELNASFSNNVNEGHGSQQIVLDNVEIEIPAGFAGDFFNLEFDQAYNYNGVDNLVVEIQRGQCSANVDIVLQEETVAKFLLATQSELTGNLSLNTPLIKMVFTGGKNAINYTVLGMDSAPFEFNSYSWRVLALYPATDISGAGWINGVALKLGQDIAMSQTYTLAVKMAHTNKASLDTQVVDSNYFDTPQTVTDSVSLIIPANILAGEYIWIPFGNEFLYNGVSNLIIELVVSSASGDILFETGNSSSTNNMLLRGQTSTTWAEGANQYSYNIALRFAGSSMDLIPNSFHRTSSYPFNGTNNDTVQFLYKNFELGSSGELKNISLRLAQAASAEVFQNVNVTLAHSNGEILISPLDNNMLDP